MLAEHNGRSGSFNYGSSQLPGRELVLTFVLCCLVQIGSEHTKESVLRQNDSSAVNELKLALIRLPMKSCVYDLLPLYLLKFNGEALLSDSAPPFFV